jgi:hypothetical protein
MAVYILGAGASCCTDPYDQRLNAPAPFAEDFRPPVMARFFEVARSRFQEVRMRNLDSVLNPIGLSVAALERHEAGCANIEHVLSFCDLLGRAIAHWAYGPRHRGRIRRAVWGFERALARPPFHFFYLPPDIRRLCRKVRGWPIFGQCPKRTLVQTADALRKAARKSRGGPPQSGLSEWESVWLGFRLNSPIQDVLKAVREVYAPSSPYLHPGSCAPPPQCSNYCGFLANKVHVGDTIISFNYDFLLDRVLEENANLSPAEDTGPFPTLFETARGLARFLKLHGSVLWWVQRDWDQNKDYYLGNPKAGDICYRTFSEARRKISTGEFPWLPPQILPDSTRTSPEAPDSEASRKWQNEPVDVSHARYVEPLIVPPTIAKESHLARPEISKLWDQAKHDLSATDSIYVIGYSFPCADTHVSDMTRAAGGARPKHNYEGVPVRIVSKSDRDELQRLRERVQKAFPGADVEVESNDGFDVWVRKTTE